jgi:hypothetical protein
LISRDSMPTKPHASAAAILSGPDGMVPSGRSYHGPRFAVGALKIKREVTPVCTENLIRVDNVMESPKLAE